MQSILLSLSLIITGFAFSQSDTLNQLNADGEKTGWWVTYLDENLAEVKDSSDAVYYRFSYMDGRFNYFNMGPLGTKKNPLIPPENEDLSNSPIVLNGIYRANYTDGASRFYLRAENGILKEYKEFYKDGTLMTHFDYTKSCGDTPFHFCIYQYKQDGTLKYKGTVQTP